MDENLSLEGYDTVWQRVTEHRESDIAPVQTDTLREQAVCIIKQSEKSCAVRFIPKI